MEGIPVGVSAERSSMASLRGENWASVYKMRLEFTMAGFRSEN